MALSREFRQTVIERAHRDPKFCKELLKELVREAVKNDPDVLEKALNKIKQK